MFKTTTEILVSTWLAVAGGHGTPAENQQLLIKPNETVVMSPAADQTGATNFVAKNTSKKDILIYPTQKRIEAPWKSDTCFAPVAHESVEGSVRCEDMASLVPITEGKKEYIQVEDDRYYKLTLAGNAKLYTTKGEFIETLKKGTDVYTKEYAQAGSYNKKLMYVFAVERNGQPSMADRERGIYGFIEYRNLR